MSLLTTLDSLNESDIKVQQELLADCLATKYPGIDIRRGAFHDLVLGIHAIYFAKLSKEIERFKKSNSLLAITEDPTLADEGIVDRVLSNYNVYRRPGRRGFGKLMIEFSADISVLIAAGTQFTYEGFAYTVDASTVAYSSTSTGYGTSQLLIPLSSGNYGCTVSVTAVKDGATTFVPKNGQMTLTSGSLPHYTKAYALEDFVAGSDSESNKALTTRLADGLATPCWGNRHNIAALMKANLPNIVDVSVIGFGDAEMHRDISPVLPVSVGGKTDVYIKTTPYLTTETRTLTAVYTGRSGLCEQWQVTLPDDFMPAFYKVIQVSPVNSDGSVKYNIGQQLRVSTKTGLTAVDATYSAYQRNLLTVYTDDAAVSDTEISREFDITVKGLTDISAAQAIANDPRWAPVGGDALVKAAVPAMLSVTLTLTRPTTTDADEQAIRTVLTDYINQKGFGTMITASELIQQVTGYLGAGQTIYSTQLDVDIWGPQGYSYRASSGQVIELPNDPAAYVTPNTCTFFANSITIKYL